MEKQEKTPQQQQASKDILKAVLTWSHVITVSILLLAAIHNIGGLALILFKPKIAESVINYTRVWQTFFITGIIGYDAKSTVENVMKIGKSVKELKSSVENETTTTTAATPFISRATTRRSRIRVR